MTEAISPHDDLILHDDERSGNCYKLALTAGLLGLPLQRRGNGPVRAGGHAALDVFRAI